MRCPFLSFNVEVYRPDGERHCFCTVSYEEADTSCAQVILMCDHKAEKRFVNCQHYIDGMVRKGLMDY